MAAAGESTEGTVAFIRTRTAREKKKSSADGDARETTLNPGFKWGRLEAFGLPATRADLHSGLPLRPRGRD